MNLRFLIPFSLYHNMKKEADNKFDSFYSSMIYVRISEFKSLIPYEFYNTCYFTSKDSQSVDSVCVA